MDPISVLNLLGSFATRAELTAAGVSATALKRQIADGAVLRIRRGWFALPSVPTDVIRAIRVGGSLGCVSGATLHGTWKPADIRLHTMVRNDARAIMDPESGVATSPAGMSDKVVVHWTARISAQDSRGLMPIVDCLVQTIACQPADIAFAVVESALNRQLVSRMQWDELWRRCPASSRYMLKMARADAGSGNESIFRFRMSGLGVAMQSQIWVSGVGYVDFLIGDRLIVEIDSEKHHGGREARLRDIQRDATAAALGAVTLRFDQSQILYDWDYVEATVLAVIERGDHMRRA